MTKVLKKPLSIILAVLMVMSVFIAVPMTASAATTGSFGSLTWNIDEEGTLTFSGSGATPMDAFAQNGDVKKVIINDSVTELGAYAFDRCSNLTEVDIQNPSVSLEGTSHHFSNTGVTTVTLPEGMTTIPQGMFRHCRALTTVDLPSTITSIEDMAFLDSGLQSISVPEGATYDSSSFETDSLQSLTLEGSSPMTFTGRELTFLSDAATVYIPEGSTYVYSNTTATLYVKDSGNEEAQDMLEYAQENLNMYIEEFGYSPEEALEEVNDMFGDWYGMNVTTEGPFTVPLNEGDKCEAVFGGATIGKYVPAPTTYTVTWKNSDEVLETDTDVAEGTTPTYDGAEPTKADDETYTYTFSGWSDGTNTYGASDTLPSVSANVTYTATFDATDLFVINDGVLTAYNGDKSALTTLTIPDEVTEISGSVFKNCTNLESVNLNNVVKVTGESFFGCSKLSSVIGTKLKYAGYRSFCTTTASLRTLTMRSGNNGADKKGLDSAFIVQAMVDAGQPTWYFYTVVRKGNDGNDFHYTAFNQTFLVEEGVEPFIESDYEAEQTASSGVNKSAIIYIKIDDENRTIKVKSNESNVSGYGPGTKILIDGVQYTIVEETGINYGDDNYIKQDDKVTVSDSDEGKKKFDLHLNQYLNMQMLGVQLKKSIETKGGEDGIRFVTAVNSKLLKGSNIKDYGYIVVKAKADTPVEKIYAKMDKLTYDKVDNKNRFRCYGSSNTISGKFGQYASETEYKYVTLSLTGTGTSNDTVAARFYVQTKDDKYYYADYIDGNNATHGGMAFNLVDVFDNLK